jgi:Cd2+/Zn2+-exporting ATPase
MQKYHLANLDCANCAAKIEEAIQKTPGVRFASVDFATTTLFLDAEDFLDVKDAIRRVEPAVRIREKVEYNAQGEFDLRRRVLPILLAVVLFSGGLIFYPGLDNTPSGYGLWLVFGSAYLVCGWGVLSRAGRNILRGQVFDEHFLMSVATLGAIAIGEMPEAVGVMLFYQVGEFVQDLSVQRARRSIRGLLEVKPDRANVLVDGEFQSMLPESVRVGDTIQVRAGEKIPLDGEVLNGTSLVDTSPLTGESRPRNARPGDSLMAGSINLNGMLTLKVTRPFAESSISRILELVESAGSRKAATEKFITRFAKVYSPMVVFAALGVAFLPPLLFGASLSVWIYRALVVLVISCPCALVISIPLGYFGGVGGASRRGILVKGSDFLDTLAAVRTVIFDKTGTLTQGVFQVTQVLPQNGFSETDLLYLAVQTEAGSNHPIAQSIREAYGEVKHEPIEHYQEIAGHGVQATIGGRDLLAGSDGLLHRENISHTMEMCDLAGTVVHVAVDGTHAGCLVIADQIKPDAHKTITDLRRAGIERIIMLTGDQQSTAQEVAQVLGVDDFRAGLMPEEKVEVVEQILAERSDGKVAFVGDGINDAPALARADVGIAMGALGSEAAIETADVVIMTDSPSKVVDAIRVARRTRAIIWQNIILALVIKAVFIALGVAGIASMWMAVFGDMGVALLAVANATRVLRSS